MNSIVNCIIKCTFQRATLLHTYIDFDKQSSSYVTSHTSIYKMNERMNYNRTFYE